MQKRLISMVLALSMALTAMPSGIRRTALLHCPTHEKEVLKRLRNRSLFKTPKLK